mgnify:CR=1 FL=1
MYLALPANTASAVPHSLINGRGDGDVAFEMAYPLSGLWAMLEMALLGTRFTPNFQAPELGTFSVPEYLLFLVYAWMNTLFAVTCIILMTRLAMAMLTVTFRGVQEKALLEWRLLIAQVTALSAP